MKCFASSLLIFFTGILFSQEKHLSNLQKLTFGGDNAEAYFSPDGQHLTMQVTNPNIGASCDQIFTLNLQDKNVSPQSLKLVSTGKGRTTCSFFMPDGQHILYASTHGTQQNCPEPPKHRSDGKYVWAVYPEFDIYMADLNGKVVKQITNSPGYDAEVVVSPNGKKIAFTSMRSGDLEIWMMDIDGTNLKQITHELGYDGGCFFSHDSQKLVFRASRPKTEQDIADYKALLHENLVTPTQMEIYTCNIDGSNLKQITHLGKANWAPYFHPSDSKIIFSSNHHAKKGYDFQLYMIDTTGQNLEQITYFSEFNAFPMFSPDGKKIVFSSNREQGAPRETNVFIADWVEGDPVEYTSTQALKRHVSYLASDDLKGRLTGSEGEQKAAMYIASFFQDYGLKPFEHKAYMQAFDYQIQTNPHDSTSQKVAMTGNNVLGYLDNGAPKTIVIGAHHDHLGLNEHHNSTKPDAKNEIHNGADDNASGVAGILELARMFSVNQNKEPVNILFVAFSGEEDGLMGSKHVVEVLKAKNHPVLAMINMDMIGRLDTLNNLMVGGIGTSPVWGELVEKNKPAGFALTIDSSGVGPSDYTSFYLKDIPVLNFFTGTHADYHKPSDDEDKINYEGTQKIIDYVFRVVDAVSQKMEVPFTKTKNNAGKTAPKYKVTMGIMPDYKDYGDGLHIDAISEDRPAQKAGLLAGDIIMKIGTCEVKEVYSYMECLSKLKSGDEVEVLFKRGGVEQKVMVKF